MLRSIRAQLGLLTALCALVTVIFATVPSLRFGYRAPNAHVALETAAAIVALLAAFLVAGRLRRSVRLDDLILATSLALLAVTNLVFRAVPALGSFGEDRFVVWTAIGGRLIAAALLAAAPFARHTVLERPRRTITRCVGSVAAAVGTLILVVALTESYLPRPPSAMPGTSASHPDLSAHPSLLAAQLVSALLYAVAAVGFARRAERRSDPLMHWLALASVLAAFSRINYFLYPSIYTNWVYLGDFFRFAFFALLLVGALLEISSYWQTAVRAAALEERRRIARDLHDGLAQEVAFLRRNLALLVRGSGDADLPKRLKAAADRAAQESRQVVSALSSPPDEGFETLFADTVAEVAGREQVKIKLDMAEKLTVDAPRAEVLLRVASEALTNAARHSGADEVDVRLERAGERARLVVSDRGSGFEPAEAQTSHVNGFGLRSIRDRSAAAGGHLTIVSHRGAGTTVELII